MQTVYAHGGCGSQQRQVADGADVVFTDTVPDSPKPDLPKLGFRVRVRVSVSANRVSANRD